MTDLERMGFLVSRKLLNRNGIKTSEVAEILRDDYPRSTLDDIHWIMRYLKFVKCRDGFRRSFSTRHKRLRPVTPSFERVGRFGWKKFEKP